MSQIPEARPVTRLDGLPVEQDEPQATAIPAPPEAAAAQPAKRKKGHSRGIDKSKLSPEERRKHERSIEKKSEEKRKKLALASSHLADSEVEIKPKDAADLLRERGIQKEHVIELCVTLAEVAARHHKIPFNKHLFTQGLRATLAKTTLPEITGDDVVDGEVIHQKDLYAVWDYGFWRWPDSFEQWLADRLRLKSSAFEMSKLLGKEDFGQKHEEWTEFAPKWDPRRLRPGYTQKQGLAWLDAQLSPTEGGKKRYLLVACRNSMKSTWARILCLCLTCCYPDARILIISETNKLSKKGMRELRGYLEMRVNNPTLFQQYFPEICTEPDDGSSVIYDNPLRHLGLPQNSIESSSMESANTGSRFDFALFDDPISRDNGTSDEDQRQAAVEKHGSIMKLREPAGFALNIQTPWVEQDLGDVMINRNNDDPEHPLAVRIDPVFEILPHAKNKQLLELKGDDVHLNFLPKLNWRFVRDEMRSPEGINFFRTQYLCEWIKEDEGLRLTFQEDDLRNHTRHRDFFKGASLAQTYMVLDRSYSTAITADPSAIAVIKIMPVQAHENIKPKLAMVVWSVVLDRLKESELIDRILDQCAAHKPTIFVSQKDKGQDEAMRFEIALRKQAMLRSIVLPNFRWLSHTAGTATSLQKARRMKTLEQPLVRDELWFVSSEWNDPVFAQFLKVGSGIFKSSTTHRKDDAPDAISQAYVQFFPKHIVEPEDPQTARQKEEQREQDFQRERREQMHAAMFGGTRSGHVSTAKDWGGRSTEPAPQPQSVAPQPAHAKHFPRGNPLGGAILPSVMRGIPKR